MKFRVFRSLRFLFPPDPLPPDEEILQVRAKTPGVVLIDELDVHLHPKWQCAIAKNLKQIFPSIQFITTTRSPQVIGEMQPEEILLLREGAAPEPPRQSFGMDINWILDVLMDADEQDPESNRKS